MVSTKTTDILQTNQNSLIHVVSHRLHFNVTFQDSKDGFLKDEFCAILDQTYQYPVRTVFGWIHKI